MNKMLSIDNGATFYAASEIPEIMPEINARHLYRQIVNFMDDETREAVHMDLAPCTDAEFLAEYLRRANDDLIIG